MSIEIIDILKPKNGLSFKLIEDIDIAVQGYTSLADAVSHFVTTESIQQIINAALSGKQDTLSSAQLAACNSGITSELVAQISLNTAAIAGKASTGDLAALSAEVDDKADASDLTTATASLQAQIDNIVSGSTSDSEVINARVGEDGTSYNTLKARLDAENTELSSEIESLNSAVFSLETHEIENISDVGTATAPNTAKWIAAIVPANSEITELKQKVVANSTDIVKLEVWEQQNNGNYTLARTVTASSIAAGYGTTYVLTFDGFKTTKNTIITYADTSSQGWLQYSNESGYSCKKFDASLTAVSESDIQTVSSVKLHADITYIVKIGINSDIANIESDITSINGSITSINGDITDINAEIANIENTLFTTETYNIENIVDVGTATAPNAYKWIAAIIPENADVSDIKQRVTGNSTDVVKLQLWEKQSNGNYTLSNTITAESIEADSGTYILTFAGFKTTKETIVTYLDTSSGGWLHYSNDENSSCKKFNAALTTVTTSDISDTATVKLHVDLEYTIKVERSTDKYIFTVDSQGHGDYTSLVQAVSELPSGSTIIVKPGVYEGTVRAFEKRLNLLGTDRKKCIIRSTDGRYENPAIECCCGYISNLTIESKYISGTSHEISSSDSGAYALHCERSSTNESIAVGDCLTLENCDLVSDFFPAMGVGTFKDWSLNVINCSLTSNQVANRATYTDTGGLGALYFHDMNGQAGTAYIKIKDTIIRTGSLEKTMTIYDLERTDVDIRCEFINNTIYSAINGFTDSIWWRGITTPFDNHYSLEAISHGNTGTIFNS